MRFNGCHNREPYKPSMLVQVGCQEQPLNVENTTRIPLMALSPFRMATDCQYTLTELGAVDAGCDGCRHKSAVMEAA